MTAPRRRGRRCARSASQPDDAGAADDDAKLARALADRAERLLGPLVERYPIVDEALGRTRTPAWILAILLLLAFASGIGLSALDGSRRINILAFPFIGLIAWNLLIYVVLAVGWLRRRRGGTTAPLQSRRWFGRAFARRIGPLLKRTARVHAVLGERDRQLCRELGGRRAAPSSRSTRGAGCTSRPRPSRSG